MSPGASDLSEYAVAWAKIDLNYAPPIYVCDTSEGVRDRLVFFSLVGHVTIPNKTTWQVTLKSDATYESWWGVVVKLFPVTHLEECLSFADGRVTERNLKNTESFIPTGESGVFAVQGLNVSIEVLSWAVSSSAASGVIIDAVYFVTRSHFRHVLVRVAAAYSCHLIGVSLKWPCISSRVASTECLPMVTVWLTALDRHIRGC